MNSITTNVNSKIKSKLSDGEEDLIRILQGTNQSASSINLLGLKQKSIKKEPFDPGYDLQTPPLASCNKIKKEKPFQYDGDSVHGSTVQIKKEDSGACSSIDSVKLLSNNDVIQASNSSIEHPVTCNVSMANWEQSSRLLRMLEATVDDIAAGKVTVSRTEEEEDSTNSWAVKSSTDGELLMVFQFVGDDEKDKNSNIQDLSNKNNENLNDNCVKKVNVKTESDIPEMLRIMKE